MMVDSIYVPKPLFEVTVPQPWNVLLTGVEPALLKFP